PAPDQQIGNRCQRNRQPDHPPADDAENGQQENGRQKIEQNRNQFAILHQKTLQRTPSLRLFLAVLFALGKVLQQHLTVAASSVLGLVLSEVVVYRPLQNIRQILLTDIVVGIIVRILVKLALVLHLGAV